jgi:hypothetical protein
MVYRIGSQGYDVLTDEAKERQRKAKGLMQIVAFSGDIKYRG